MTPDLPPDLHDDDALAAEYVLGVLPLAERVAIERRLKDDQRFAALVQAWDNRLTPLNEETAPVVPSPEVLARLESRLFPTPARRPWYLSIWAGATSGVVAILVAGFFLTAPPQPTYTATLAANSSEVSYLVQVSDAGIALTRTGPAPGATQAHELWLIVGDAAPVSLGLIGPEPLPLPELLAPGMVLAVSLEPSGGSPTGAPTGPVLALGPIQDI